MKLLFLFPLHSIFTKSIFIHSLGLRTKNWECPSFSHCLAFKSLLIFSILFIELRAKKVANVTVIYYAGWKRESVERVCLKRLAEERGILRSRRIALKKIWCNNNLCFLDFDEEFLSAFEIWRKKWAALSLMFCKCIENWNVESWKYAAKK